MSGPLAPSGVAAALARARLGVFSLVFAVMAAAAPLTVVAGGATGGFAVTGSTGIPLAYLVVAAILAIFSIGYVAMSREIVNAGAFYTYIAHGLGKTAGVAAAFVAVVGYNTMQVGLYGGFGVVTAGFAQTEAGIDLPWWSWALLAWALIAVLGGRRIEHSSRVLAVLLIGEILVAVIFAVVHLAHPAGGTVTYTTLSPDNLIGTGLGAALATAIAGFVGFESPTVYGEEARDPKRTVPRSIFLSLAVIGLLYAACAWAMSVAAGPGDIVKRSTSDGSELIFTLAAPYVPAAFVFFGHLLFGTSLFAALLAFHNTAARYHFALGREGVLPSVLARVSLRTKAPVAGSLMQTAIAFVVIVVYAFAGWDPFTRLFFWLTVLGGVGVLILMTVTSLVVAAYYLPAYRRGETGLGRGVVAPLIAAVLLGGVLIVTLDQYWLLIGVDPASALRWQLPGVYAIAAAGGALWAAWLRSQRPWVYDRIGNGANHEVSVAARHAAVR